MNMFSKNYSRRLIQGFSLIEVLVAVLVMSVGMLALAALQTNLTRATADARTRSDALTIAQRQIDRLRGQVEANNPTNSYISLANETRTATTADGVSNASESFTITRTVERWIRSPTSTTTFCKFGTTGCAAANFPTSPGTGVVDPARPEYKIVNVEVSWSDAAGNDLSVTLSDIYSSVPASNSNTLNERDLAGGSDVEGPRVRIIPPSSVGVIPVAVSSGNEATAASNPRPKIYERGFTDKVSFEIFQYAGSSSDAVLRQKIEVAGIGCRCELTAPTQTSGGNTLLFAAPREPTYWDGTAYADPAFAPTTKTQGKPKSNFSNQDSTLCTTCCSDHHDHTAATVKVDGFRPSNDFAGGNHNHYPAPSSPLVPSTTAVAAGEEYFEVCRMIRVDGIWQVATDAHMVHMAFLETDASRAPLSAKTSRYQTFVREYLKDKFLTTSNPNTIDPLAGLATSYSDIFDLPTQEQVAVGSQHAMHNRSLYIDFIESSTFTELSTAKQTCIKAGKTAEDALLDCLLLSLPIVTFNGTDIAQWRTESNVNHVSVTNLQLNVALGSNLQDDALATSGNRGIVTGKSSGTEDVIARMMQSNSGLVDVNPTDPCDGGLDNDDFDCADKISEDTQTFCAGTDCTVANTGPQFDVVANRPSGDTDFNFSAFGVNYVIPSVDAGDCEGLTAAANARTFECVAIEGTTMPADVQISVTGYNRQEEKQYANPCPSATGNVTGYTCANYQVSAATVGTEDYVDTATVIGTQGYLSEITRLTISSPGMPEDGQLNLSFTFQGDVDRTPTCEQVPTEVCSKVMGMTTCETVNVETVVIPECN